MLDWFDSLQGRRQLSTNTLFKKEMIIILLFIYMYSNSINYTKRRSKALRTRIIRKRNRLKKMAGNKVGS
jgi:hypothetical protein